MSINPTRVLPQEEEDVFGVVSDFAGYVSKPEITNLLPNYLVKGSKNVLVDYGNRVTSRNGFILYNQVNTGAGGVKGSYEWETSSGANFSLRSFDHSLQFDWNGEYNTLLSNLRSPYLSFTKVLDYNEQQDVLLFVLSESNVRRWSGGVSKVRNSTSMTVTKQGVITGQTTIAFIAGNGSTINPTITDSANNFLNAGFAAGDDLNVSGSVSNNSNFKIAAVSANTLTLVMNNVLITETAGSSVTLYNQTGPTWKSARFFSTIGGRAITYQGADYTYTGGEDTDTLTGLTSFPIVSLGDSVWQASDSFSLPSSITNNFPNFFPDLIATQLNIISLASTKNVMTFGSSNIDYTNFTLTSPRAPGDPYQQPLTSGPATCIVAVDGDADVLNITNTLIFGSGIDAFDQIDFHMSQDNSEELLRIIRYKTAKGKGIISKDAICPISNNTIYISREPALDSFSEAGLENEKGHPISDPIKDDFDSYDFTDAHVIYWKRGIYISLPVEGLVLIYDLMRNLWQPPQTIPVSRFAIINDWLYGHSSITNETYKLFVGTNDNGNFIAQRARFAYNNGGTRFRSKNLTEYWSDGYITANGELDMSIYFGFGGSAGTSQMSILGTDATIVVEPAANPLGNSPLGENPLGGGSIETVPSLFGSTATLLRFNQIDTVEMDDYFEHFVEYSMDTLDGQFVLVAHGSDQFDAGTSPVGIKK